MYIFEAYFNSKWVESTFPRYFFKSSILRTYGENKEYLKPPVCHGSHGWFKVGLEGGKQRYIIL